MEPSLALLAAALVQAMTTDAWSAMRESLVQRLRRDAPDGAEHAVATLDRTASEVAGHPAGKSAVVGLLQGRLEPLIAASPELGVVLQDLVREQSARDTSGARMNLQAHADRGGSVHQQNGGFYYSDHHEGDRFAPVAQQMSFFKQPRRVMLLAAGVLAAALLATGYLLMAPDEVADYRKQVVGTCKQVNRVLSEQHNDAIYLRANPGSDDPLGGMAIRKERFLFHAQSNLDSARQSFTSLNTQKAPDELREQHALAKKAQDDWLTRMGQDMQRYERELKDGDLISKVNSMSMASQPWHTRLNDAMTSLAGETCQTTASSPGS
ncbi:hypothetical protein DEJ50_03060 [Streptomyces venezuelae]|uniref:Uncharacterized protein n=1 Tax=Streptomyces venezuelae TaxID=54571 RepID=A0A5P2CVQ6_STRVZ|nr:hypothetical protein [Streptomyces venezuelae]QES46982.1 hypothetical protein DEJ50_03060 [Streptomyces venezuelae]